MKYYIKRDLNEYGPYTLADLQRYVAQGNISLNDLTRSEGMADWVPVSQVIGNIPPVPSPQAPAAAVSGAAYPTGMQATGYAAQPAVSPGGVAYAQGAYVAQAVGGPVPPDFHWALVLVISMFCSIFQIVWLFIEASFVKKIMAHSDHLVYLISATVMSFVTPILFFVVVGTAAAANPNSPPAQGTVISGMVICGVIMLAAIVIQYIGVFKMRARLEEYYNTVEPINLRLSGVMTFFFALFYFQHHFSRIAQWKKTGFLSPQG